MSDAPWLLAVLGGPILMGIALAYFVFRNKHRDHSHDYEGEAATRELYKEEGRAEEDQAFPPEPSSPRKRRAGGH